jgi:DNA-directed RNA polymerase subunit M/transcription elongation factor TFIIS
MTLSRKNDIHCGMCGNTDFSYGDNYCKICVSYIYHFITKDTKWVEYDSGVPLDEFGHAMECPACGARVVTSYQMTCPACGAGLIQMCSDYDKNDNLTDEKGCSNIPDGSARYCRKCGHKSAFYISRYLKDWQQELAEILKDPRRDSDII